MSNCCAGPFITAGSQTNKAKQTVAISSTAFVSFGVFDDIFSLSAHHYDIAKCQNAREERTLVEREFGLATIPGINN